MKNSSTTLIIDLGLNNSVAMVVEDGYATIVYGDSPGQYQFPSQVSYSQGKAYSCNSSNSGRFKFTVRNAIRLLGLTYQQFLDLPKQNDMDCEIVEHSDGYPRFVVSNEGMQKDCIEVTSDIISTIKRNALRMCGRQAIDQCYVAIPTNYSHDQLAALRAALERSELPVTGFIPKPYAAFMSWYNGIKDHSSGTAVVLDCGGSALSVASIKYEKDGQLRILSSDGNPYLGGSSVDMRIAEMIINEVRHNEDLHFDPLSKPNKRLALMRECESAKIALSYSMNVDIDLESLGVDEEYSLSRDMLNAIVSESLLPEIEKCLWNVLKGTIDDVFLVGGSSRLLHIKDYLQSKFHCRIPDVNPEFCVVEGVANYVLNGTTTRYAYGILYGSDTVVLSLPKGREIPCNSERLVLSLNNCEFPTVTLSVYRWGGEKGKAVMMPKKDCSLVHDYVFLNPSFIKHQTAVVEIILRIDCRCRMEISVFDKATGVEWYQAEG